MSSKGEFALIDWIRRHRSVSGPRISIGIGDDLAGLITDEKQLLFGCDQVLDGVHFQLEQCGPQAAGRKALARNLSDVAAMAGRPLAAVASVSLPNDISNRQAQQIVEGMSELARQFDCPVVGGDVGSWQGPLAIHVSILASTGEIEPVRRSGAKPGDEIMITGELGGSILGRHLSFTPRVNEARTLAQAVTVHAMIDISDGLPVDLHHITTESGCGARILSDRIPVSTAARELSKTTSKTALQHSLEDGEDYELLFTVSASDAVQAEKVLADAGAKVSRIGRIVESGVVLVGPDESQQELTAAGFEHFKSGD